MSLRITQNVEAFNAYRNLSHTQHAVSRSMARLSSGYRINSAADDAAGLGISESMTRTPARRSRTRSTSWRPRSAASAPRPPSTAPTS
jgi:flagellin-like hook-associated protein FlgL